MGPHPQRQRGRPYAPHHHPRHQHHAEHGHRLEPRPSGMHSPTHSHRASSGHRPERRASESSGVSTGSSSRGGLKRPHDDPTKRPVGASRHPSSSASKMGQRSKTGPFQSSMKALTKMGIKPGTKMTKTASAKAAASKDPDTSAKPPPAKKKKKVATPSQSSTAAARLVYLTGIPADASEQEVTDLVGSFGKINNVVLMPGCEGEGEREKGEGQKASVCMVRAEDAQALAHCTSLSIRDQQITASLAKKTELEKSDINKGKPGPTKDKCAGGEDLASETDQKTSDEKGVVLISGLPESGWSEGDIIKLVQPFGTPSDIILATEIGKVLVSLPDLETAQEMVKVHTFIPVKMQDSELKMIHLKQPISLSTPVALYNFLKGSLDPLETPVPVGWSSLLVISNVPDTPTGPSEVQKLVRRFGTVSKTLVLNNNMIICEMATAAMALSVYKRFQKFPCIIQNNPLSFSRKADPKANTQTKVIAAYLDSAKVSPANGKDSQTAPAAGKEDPERQENGESVSEGKEKENDEKDSEKTEEDEKISGKEDDVVVEEEVSKDEDDKVKKDQATGEVSDSAAALDAKPEADVETATTETAPVEPANEEPENSSTPSGQKETTASSSDGGEATSTEAATPELPKVTQEMVDALLEECRTRTAGRPNQTAAPPGGKQGEVKTETVAGEGEERRRVVEEQKELVEDSKEEEEEEEEEKKQERERKEREAKREEAAREKERKERERRAREREERTRRERERREEERREWERRERERKERRRTHREGSSGSRSSGRSEASKRSTGRDGPDRTTVAEKAKPVVEEEEFDDFPFDMGDFVTVDEVGDVTDLPNSPPPLPPPVPMEASEEGAEDTPASAQQDAPGVAPTAATVLETTPSPAKSEAHGAEHEPVTAPAAASENSASSELTPGPALTLAASPLQAPEATSPSNQTVTPAPQPEPETTPETVTTPMATSDSTPEVESLPTPAPATTASPLEAAPVANVEADSAAESPAAGGVKGEEEKEESPVNHSQAEGQEEAVAAVASGRPEEEKMMQDEEDKEKRAPAVSTAKRERSEDEKSNEEECVKKKPKTQTPCHEDYSLPPFDPNNPVGMEFLLPKTGFFCKVCNRFFSGTQEAEINHCKSLKHYENLQKYLQSRKTTANPTVKPDSS
ncbi:uncharacterized protein LOC139914575 [Centroberyx gerrardi]